MSLPGFTFMPQQDNVPDLIAAWNKGGISAANALARNYTPHPNRLERMGDRPTKKRVRPRHPNG
jgi:hypothetical protein